jgi:heme oxygenase
MILILLREQTRDVHTRLESRIDLLERASSLSAYGKLLMRFYGFYLPFELRLREVFSLELPEFDFVPRIKLHRLEQDMRAISVSPPDLSMTPFCRDLPEFKTAAQALGGLYVVEGATLGGKIIGRHLQETLGLNAANGAAFFDGYGAENGRMWRAFGEMVTRYAEGGAHDAEIIQGANETFAAFERWFTQGENTDV